MAEVMGRYMEPKEVLEAGLQGRLPQHHYHNDLIVSNTSAINGANTENSVYLNNHDQGEQVLEWSVSGANPGLLEDLDVKLVDSYIGKVLNAFINAQDDDEREPHDPNHSGERGHHHEEVNSTREEEDLEYDEEEEIELEFERAVKKLDTHTMHCPKCNTQVTKVILRRKRRVALKQQHKPLNLLGCLRCLRVFIPNGNRFNMFGIFGTESSKKPQATPLLDESISPADENIIPNLYKNVVIQEKAGGCFGLFRIFGNKNDNESIENPSTIDVTDHAPSDFSCVNGNMRRRIEQGQSGEADKNLVGDELPGDHVTIDIRNDLDENTLGEKILAARHEFIDEMQKRPAERLEEGDYRNRDGGGAMNGQQTGLRTAEPIGASDDEDLKLIEIVKSIVYGGLMESITSLSIVASAAGSHAATLNIIALGLASLIGGLFIIGLNLWDLKDDRNQRANKYQQVLGRRENFPLHVTVSILSFFVFGLIPPVTYGFSFRKSDDRDFKILTVAATSLLCVISLAIGKAYVEKAPKFYMYIKTIMYYVSTGFIVSGVSFVVGNLIKKFIEEHGLLNTSSPAATLSLQLPA